MKYFKGKYRMDSMRMKDWDYTSEAMYMVTIATHDKKSWFGEIDGGEMVLNEYGKMVHELWGEMAKRYSWVELDEMCVMPDHVHGIIGISFFHDVETPFMASFDKCDKNKRDGVDKGQRDGMNAVSTGGGVVPPSKNPMIVSSLSTVIRWFKGRVTHDIRKNGCHNFRWQSGFHDRIIRDALGLNDMRRYIRDNALKHGHE